MEGGNRQLLSNWEIHGFRTTQDLNIRSLMEDASVRWFRPNEVHAILSNFSHFKIQPQPVDTPKSGTVLLFDRKMLRNFRKDGYNWKKKKDGRTIQEAHEKLKIGNEERIHVYYARNQDDPSFYRRCYWLLDKNLERIVLVHYRQTSEDSAVQHLSVPVECTEALPSTNMMQYGSPLTPMNSTTGSSHSDLSGSAVLSEEINSSDEHAVYTGSGLALREHVQPENHGLSLDDAYALDWADIALASDYTNFDTYREGNVTPSSQQLQLELQNSLNTGNFPRSQGISSFWNSTVIGNNNDFSDGKQVGGAYFQTVDDQGTASAFLNSVNQNSQAMGCESNPVVSRDETPEIYTNSDILLSQSSFGQWNCLNEDSFGSLNGLEAGTLISNGDKPDGFTVIEPSSTQEQIFHVTEFSPEWAYSSEGSKVLVIGFFDEAHKHLNRSNIYCIFDGMCVVAEMVQDGVYRCTALPHAPGLVNFFLSLDGRTPISQILTFDYRSMPIHQSKGGLSSSKGIDKLKKLQIRLAHLLFSTANTISVLSSKIQPRSLNEAKRYASVTSPLMEKDWTSLLKLSNDSEISYVPHSEDLFEIFLKNKLQEWLLQKVAEGRKITAYDSQGQGVIHLCAILDYTWAARLFALSGFSLDFRDASGWTALHWAAYYGREKMVAALLSTGANPSLVTDPTPENPGGCTAADLASKEGYEGLAAYLAEKGLRAHFQAMSLSGNIPAPVPSNSDSTMNSETLGYENLSEQELCLKESLAAYRNAADAADRIQSAFRERALKQQTKAIQLVKPEVEATQIVSALRIQHAFRNYNRRKLMKAAARIQSHFRTWQARRNFLNMRKQAIRIQAIFRGHQVRRQYRKIMWSVGVLEKAVLRWRLKRKGLRGIQTESTKEMMVDKEQEDDPAEEDFFRIGREQAEERVQRSVVKVQAMFRSYQAQQEYRRMKLAHEEAKLEFSLDGALGIP